MTLEERLAAWLGDDGRDFFTGLKRDHGELSVVLSVPYAPGRSFPHSVHFREGMAVRNWLRGQPECAGWDPHKLDAEWAPLVEKALGI